MGLLTDIKVATKALPAVVVRDRYLPAVPLVAQQTGINRFGTFGFNALELFPAENPELLRKGYMENHYVFTIADWKAQRMAQAPAIVYEVKDEKSLGRYKHLNPLQKANEYTLRRKALEEVMDPADNMVRLLQRPNPAQTWGELIYATSVYWDFGNALLYGVSPDLGANQGQVQELYLLPTALYAGKNPSTAGYSSYVDATSVNNEIPGQQVLHLRRFNPDPSLQGGTLWGMSKLTPARRLLTKSTNAIEAEAETMQNRGSRTIIFPKHHDGFEAPTPEQARAAADEIRRKLRQAGSGGIAANSIELGVIELGLSPVDLDIIKSNVGTKEDFCALWHIDANSVFSTTTTGALGGNKQEEANKASIRGGVLPDIALFYQKLSAFVTPAYNAANKYSRYIEANTDVYPELQMDKGEQLAWLSTMGSSLNERREAMGYERDPNPSCDIKLVPPGFTPVTDFGAGSGEVDPENDGTY